MRTNDIADALADAHADHRASLPLPPCPNCSRPLEGSDYDGEFAELLGLRLGLDDRVLTCSATRRQCSASARGTVTLVTEVHGPDGELEFVITRELGYVDEDGAVFVGARR